MRQQAANWRQRAWLIGPLLMLSASALACSGPNVAEHIRGTILYAQSSLGVNALLVLLVDLFRY